MTTFVYAYTADAPYQSFWQRLFRFRFTYVGTFHVMANDWIAADLFARHVIAERHPEKDGWTAPAITFRELTEVETFEV